MGALVGAVHAVFFFILLLRRLVTLDNSFAFPVVLRFVPLGNRVTGARLQTVQRPGVVCGVRNIPHSQNQYGKMIGALDSYEQLKINHSHLFAFNNFFLCYKKGNILC